MGAKGQPKTGGRKKGTRNKRTLAQAYAAEIGGDTPLEHLLEVMRDATQPEDRRLSAAVAAAPYVHAKLKSIEHSGLNGGPMKSEYAVSLNFGNEDAVRSIPIDWVDRGILTIAKNSDAETQRETAGE